MPKIPRRDVCGMREIIAINWAPIWYVAICRRVNMGGDAAREGHYGDQTDVRSMERKALVSKMKTAERLSRF